MKVLILVLSSLDGHYADNLNAQKETWDSFDHPNVNTVYYCGKLKGEKLRKPCLNDKVLRLPVSDKYNMMHWKFKRALDFVWNMEWDYIFRTNASTYVRKDRVYNAIRNSNYTYAGHVSGDMVSGTGIILSRDAATILKQKLDASPNESEDSLIGSVLNNHGIKPVEALSRLNFNFAEDKILDADYWRCKSEVDVDGKIDRSFDIKAFKELYNYELSIYKSLR